MLEEKIIISSLSHPNQGAKLSYIKNTLGVNVVKLKKNEPTDRDAGIISVHDAKLEVSAVAENETDLVKARYSVVFGGWTIDALVNGAKTIELDEPDYDTKVDRIWLQQDYTATPDDIMRLRAVGDFFFNELAMIAGGKMSTAK
jgi:hypothetical protein